MDASTPYEVLRAQRIQHNQAILAAAGVEPIGPELGRAKPSSRKKVADVDKPSGGTRRSSRSTAQVTNNKLKQAAANEEIELTDQRSQSEDAQESQPSQDYEPSNSSSSADEGEEKDGAEAESDDGLPLALLANKNLKHNTKQPEARTAHTAGKTSRRARKSQQSPVETADIDSLPGMAAEAPRKRPRARANTRCRWQTAPPTEQEVVAMFRTFVPSSDGHIERESIRTVGRTLGLEYSEEQLEAMMDFVAHIGHGDSQMANQLDFQKFQQLISHIST